MFGGIAYDRDMDKSIACDVGIGKFKNRIISPKVKILTQNDRDQQNGIFSQKCNLDFSNFNPILLPIALVTGLIKLLGCSSKEFQEITHQLNRLKCEFLCKP